MGSLRVDKFPKNGKTSANPKVPNITAAKKFSPKEGPGDNMPEMRGTKPAKAQYTQNTGGQGLRSPAFGLGKGSNETYAKGPGVPVEKIENNKTANVKQHSDRGTVPTGEHHAANHRAPTSHSEFHKLGSGHWKP
jgi:hypothetical protein